MALLGDEVAAELRQEFQNLRHPVRLKVFFRAGDHPEPDPVRSLVEELAGLDPRIRAEFHDFVRDPDEVRSLGIARVPAIAVMGESRDFGLRLYGLPQGYEFGALVDAILDVSSGESGLSEETKAGLQSLDQRVHIQVFSTPTCPYCPRALRLAYQFAIESDKVTADGVEVTGYPDLVRAYRVSSVPKTVVGPPGGHERQAVDRFGFEASPAGGAEQLGRSQRGDAGIYREFIGAGSEAMLLKHVQEAAGVDGP